MVGFGEIGRKIDPPSHSRCVCVCVCFWGLYLLKVKFVGGVLQAPSKHCKQRKKENKKSGCGFKFIGLGLIVGSWVMLGVGFFG